VHANREDIAAVARQETAGRGADVVIEAAGNATAFRASVEAVRPGGEVVWLGKIDINHEINFRWGALMQEKRIRRSSYGEARPARDFPMLARAYLEGRLMLDELITQRIGLDNINEAFSALRDGKVIRSVIAFE
jgi:S-(hydroxymethyl)glutathione dehydrogenase/alcohol dehydrogenase